MSSNNCHKKVTSWVFVQVFMLFLICIICMTVFIYRNTENAVLNTLSYQNTVLSKQANNFTAQLYGLINNYGIQAFNSRYIIKLRKNAKLSNYDYILGMRALRSYVSSSDFIHSIYVYNDSQGYVFSTTDTNNKGGSSKLMEFSDRTARDLLAGTSPKGEMKPIHRTIGEGNYEDRVYSFAVYETPTLDSPVNSSMLINISAKWVEELLCTLLGDCSVAIYSSDKHLIMQSDDQVSNLLTKRGVQNSNPGYGYSYLTVENEKYVCFNAYNAQHDWYFFCVRPYAECLSGLAGVKHKAIITAAVVALLAICTSFLAIKRIYVPVNNFVSTLTSIPGAYAYMPQTHDNLDNILHQAAEQVHNYAGLLRSKYLQQLVRNPLDPANLKEEFLQYQVSLDPALPIELIIVSGPNLNTYTELLRNKAPECVLEGIILENHSVFLVQFDSVSAREACQHIAVNTGLICIYSLPIENYRRLSRSYTRLKEVWDLRIFYPGELVLGESILDSRSKLYTYPKELEAKILQALRSGNARKAKKVLEEVFENVRGYRYNVVTFIFIRLYLGIMKLGHHLPETIDTINGLSDPIETKFFALQSLDEARSIFYLLIDDAAARCAAKRQEKIARLITVAKEKIAQDYANPNLSVQIIADMMDLSADYLGRLFRSSEKISVAEYIHSRRLEQAKQLLIAATDMTIDEIATTVGYDNIKYFFTLFKNNFKMTPGEFREAHGNKPKRKHK